jgi:hypothetical protein
VTRLRLRLQMHEALGPVNRWFCSQAHGRPIDDPEVLLQYFIKSGGAANFAVRFAEAMSPDNRWFCSEFHRQDVQNPEVLWQYYMSRGTKPAELLEKRRSEQCGA